MLLALFQLTPLHSRPALISLLIDVVHEKSPETDTSRDFRAQWQIAVKVSIERQFQRKCGPTALRGQRWLFRESEAATPTPLDRNRTNAHFVQASASLQPGVFHAAQARHLQAGERLFTIPVMAASCSSRGYSRRLRHRPSVRSGSSPFSAQVQSSASSP